MKNNSIYLALILAICANIGNAFGWSISLKNDSLAAAPVLDVAVFKDRGAFNNFLRAYGISNVVFENASDVTNFIASVTGKFAGKAYDVVNKSKKKVAAETAGKTAEEAQKILDAEIDKELAKEPDADSTESSKQSEKKTGKDVEEKTISQAAKIISSVFTLVDKLNVIDPGLLKTFTIKDGWKDLARGNAIQGTYTGDSNELYFVVFYNPPAQKSKRKILWLDKMSPNGEYGVKIIKQLEPDEASLFGEYTNEEDTSYLSPIVSIKEAFYGAGTFPSNAASYNADKNKYKDVINVTDKLKAVSLQDDGTYYYPAVARWMNTAFGDPVKKDKKLQVTFTAQTNNGLKTISNKQYLEDSEFAYY